jgi:hypothetical protein
MTVYDQAALDRIRARHHDDLEVSAVVAEVEWRREDVTHHDHSQCEPQPETEPCGATGATPYCNLPAGHEGRHIGTNGRQWGNRTL